MVPIRYGVHLISYRDVRLYIQIIIRSQIADQDPMEYSRMQPNQSRSRIDCAGLWWSVHDNIGENERYLLTQFGRVGTYLLGYIYCNLDIMTSMVSRVAYVHSTYIGVGGIGSLVTDPCASTILRVLNGLNCSRNTADGVDVE